MTQYIMHTSAPNIYRYIFNSCFNVQILPEVIFHLCHVDNKYVRTQHFLFHCHCVYVLYVVSSYTIIRCSSRGRVLS